MRDVKKFQKGVDNWSRRAMIAVAMPAGCRNHEA
jgi:hypothetical protein